MSERAKTGTTGERVYPSTSSAILGYLRASTAAVEPVKGGTWFESCIFKSHLKLTALGVVCNYMDRLLWNLQRGCVCVVCGHVDSRGILDLNSGLPPGF